MTKECGLIRSKYLGLGLIFRVFLLLDLVPECLVMLNIKFHAKLKLIGVRITFF